MTGRALGTERSPEPGCHFQLVQVGSIHRTFCAPVLFICCHVIQCEDSPIESVMSELLRPFWPLSPLAPPVRMSIPSSPSLEWKEERNSESGSVRDNEPVL